MKYLFATFAALIVISAAAQTTRYDTIRYASKHYARRLEIFAQEPTRKNQVIFAGNSLTEFGDWRMLLNDSTIVNRGVAGDNTFGLLDRLNDIVSRKPRTLFLEIGINDISQNIPDSIIIKNIIMAVHRMRAALPAVKVYVHSILPTNDQVKNEYPDAFGKNTRVASINKALRASAKQSGYTYIDSAKMLTDKHGNLAKQYADPDGLHLNKDGYAVWANLLKDAMTLR